jgi:hypothetical protein
MQNLVSPGTIAGACAVFGALSIAIGNPALGASTTIQRPRRR